MKFLDYVRRFSTSWRSDRQIHG